MATKMKLPNQIGQSLPFSQPDKTSDIVFIVEGQKIHFTKAFLSVCSPVFERMFESELAEKNSKEFPLPGKKYRDIEELFKQVHPVFAPIATVTDANLLALLDMSREYQMDPVHKKCQFYICKEAKDCDQKGDQNRGHVGYIPFGTGIMGMHGNKRDKGSPDAKRVILFLYACQLHFFKEYSDALKKTASEFHTADLEGSEYYSLLDHNTLFDIYRARSQLMDRVKLPGFNFTQNLA